nr:protein HID1 isoform X2 [Helicoverpa armigera]XP_049694012.1 protein HID1 isoform X3 [Helicoverpa armigera]XP_049694013.1 protein HID1 isoform X4 [Helicoverpa armigera]XP_049694014.1 protein HID1 isoform X5 [Helicoverpa armigera]
MGNADTKLNFRKAVVQLTSKTQPIDSSDDSFWDQFWSESVTNVQDVFALVPGAEIRALREESPNNLATLVYKAVEKLVKMVDSSCRTQREQQTALNCARLLTRVLPYMLEEPEWHGFFWSSLPAAAENESVPLAQSLINAVCDLLFCPDFTVTTTKRAGPERAEELSSLDSCEYIWAGGVGFARSPTRVSPHEAARTELLRLLLTCFSETIYKPASHAASHHNKWIAYLTSPDNRHALPLFTSLVNTVCSYDPVGLGLPYNHLLFADTLEPLVEVALQVLIVTLDHDTSNAVNEESDEPQLGSMKQMTTLPDNLFINYLSRIHRDEDFQFILRGVTRLLNNPLAQTYLPNSAKKVNLHQELLVLFWKMCDYNKKFMYYVLKSSDVLEVLVPILYHLNDSRADQSRVGLMHIGVFILLLLSGERNLGVRLNKPYTATVPMDIPVFTGSHADLLVVVFHKIITTGHQRLQPLFDCLLTILVNVSPYLKTLSMVASTKLLHLLEAFSTPWFLFSQPHHHHLVFFLLEMFNNMIQYQFDGNSNLVYTIIRKRAVFHNLANLPHEHGAIARSLAAGRAKGLVPHKTTLPSLHQSTDQTPLQVDAKPVHNGVCKPELPNRRPRSRSAESVAETPMEGSRPAQPAEPGTLNPTLAETPAISTMTERESAHPPPQRLEGDASDTSDTIDATDATDATVRHDGDTREPRDRLLPARAGPDGEDRPDDADVDEGEKRAVAHRNSIAVSGSGRVDTREWVSSWRGKLPLQTIMRLLQVLVPQVEKICIDKGLTDESEILRFLQHGTLVGLLPVPHPILIRKYQANAGTAAWFRTYLWGVIYIRNVDPPIWYDTDVKLFEIQRV